MRKWHLRVKLCEVFATGLQSWAVGLYRPVNGYALIGCISIGVVKAISMGCSLQGLLVAVALASLPFFPAFGVPRLEQRGGCAAPHGLHRVAHVHRGQSAPQPHTKVEAREASPVGHGRPFKFGEVVWATGRPSPDCRNYSGTGSHAVAFSSLRRLRTVYPQGHGPAGNELRRKEAD